MNTQISMNMKSRKVTAATPQDLKTERATHKMKNTRWQLMK